MSGVGALSNASDSTGQRTDPLARASLFTALFERAGHVLDMIAVEFLDRLPNAVTIAGIVILIALAHVAANVVLWALDIAKPQWQQIAATMVASFIVGIPVVSFGQLQYRKARSAYLSTKQLTEELVLARDEAQKASEHKSRFLASMSHELRTPLNAIIGFSEILKNQVFGTMTIPRYVEYANDIHSSGHHLLSLINDVLDLAKIDAGQTHVSADGELDLLRAISDSCHVIGVIAAKNRVELTATLPSTVVRACVNERMIRQILLNLLSNAVKFTPEDGKVTVGLRLEPATGAVVEVVDTGIGMTAEETNIAVQPFGQIDSYHSRKHQGTGLGLPLAKAMVELHGGRLTIESVRGQGTTVSFNIPMTRIVPEIDERRTGSG